MDSDARKGGERSNEILRDPKRERLPIRGMGWSESGESLESVVARVVERTLAAKEGEARGMTQPTRSLGEQEA